MKSNTTFRRNRKLQSKLRRPRLAEVLEKRELLAVDGLSPQVRAAFEQYADPYNYTLTQLRNATEWVVLMSDGSGPADLAAGLETQPDKLPATGVIPNSFVVDTTTIVPPDYSSVGTGGLPLPPKPDDVIAKLRSVDGIEYFYPLVPIQHSESFIPNDDLFPDQWHLENVGQTQGSPGEDVNVVDVWDRYNGAGVVIAVVDDAVQLGHPDLEDRVVDGLSIDYCGSADDVDPSPDTPNDNHGTAVAGVALATGNNVIGVSGVAFAAGLAGIRLIACGTTDITDSSALSHASDRIDIYNNSWGPAQVAQLSEGPFGIGPMTLATLERQVNIRRNGGTGGLGNIYVFSAGNDGAEGDNVNYNNFANSRFTVAVAAVDDLGEHSQYSNPGASLLISAPSSGSGRSIVTTDRTGDDGYSQSTDDAQCAVDLNCLEPSGDYTNTFGGTSSAAPAVSGGIALMLQANPNLGWRDVQYILARSARQNDVSDIDWVTNGGGYHVNDKYGFGVLDAKAAVELAERWTNVGEEKSIKTAGIQASSPIAVPDNNARGINSTVTINQELSVEWVEVTPKINTTSRGDLDLILVSPSGTESVLARERGKQDAGSYSSWTFTTARNWGETSLGNWTLQVRDRLSGGVATLTSWDMTIYGAEVLHEPVTGGTVTGSKWQDVDADGVRDTVEVGLASWRIYADLNNDGFLNPGEPSTLTDASGAYSLPNVPVGTHFIREQQQFGWEQTFPSILGGAHVVTVAANSTVSNINFGNRLRPGTISGQKWNDLNGDGLFDPRTETGVAGVEIYLDLNRNGQHEATEPSRLTNSNGIYSFGELEAGIYRVREVLVPGVRQTFPPLGFHTADVGKGETLAALNFGNQFAPSSAYGTAWVDLNGNAAIDAGESRLASIVVYVDANNDGRIGYGEPAAMTDALGRFSFVGLAAGSPTMRAVIPPGLYQTSPSGNGGYPMVVNVGSAAANLNFGFGIQRDFGDAPAPYPTLASENGAVHAIETGFFLGATVQAELDGVHAATASGHADDDGIVWATSLIAGENARLDVTASQQGYLQGWIDFNEDGDWLDAGEQIFRDRLIPAGLTRLTFPVPATAVDGTSVARFRFAHEAGVSWAGPAASGEVEDYVVNVVNDTTPVTPAVANDDLFTVHRNSVNNLLNVLANDALGGVGLAIDAVGAPSRGGAVSLAADGRRLVYTPAAGFVGVESFNYVISNADGDTDQAVVTINVQTAPVALDAVNDSFSVNQNTTGNSLNVLANDTLGSGGRSITAVGATNHGGSVTIASGSQLLVYAPAPGYVGLESFTYTIRDSSGATDTASVTVTVNLVTGANAADDAFTVQKDSQSNSLNVLANDSSDSAITISQVGTTNHGGVVTIATDSKSLIYSPAAGFTGTETFTYGIIDLENNTDQATVTVTVEEAAALNAVNDAFTISVNTLDHIFDVIGNDTISGPGTITITGVGATNQGGTAAVVANGQRVQYSPAANFVGTETFTYTISNGQGLSDSATVTVTVQPGDTKNLQIFLRTTTTSGQVIFSANVGDTFELRGYAKDLRANPEGVFGAFLDVDYNSSLATPTGQIDHGTRFTNGVGGSLATAGVIDEVGGLSNSQSGDGNEVLVFSLTFVADAAGTVTFDANPADVLPLHDSLLLGRSNSVPPGEIDYRDTSLNVLAFTNGLNSLDVNNDGYVTGIDALFVINELNGLGARPVFATMSINERPQGFVDVNGDGFVTGIDALLIFNHLNQQSAAQSIAAPAATPSVAASAALPRAAAIAPSLADAAMADQFSFQRRNDSSLSPREDDSDSVDLFAEDVSRTSP